MMLRETACVSTHKTGARAWFLPLPASSKSRFSEHGLGCSVPSTMTVTSFSLIHYRADWAMLNADEKKLQNITVRKETPVL